jgi:hypothetical protein
MKLRSIVVVILAVGVGIGLVVLYGNRTEGRAAQAKKQVLDYLPATAPGSAPEVSWRRTLDSGLGGDLASDASGNVYVWYELGARVLKHDPNGKLLWDRSFASVARDGSVWSYVLPNLDGKFFLSRQIREECVFSELLANGTLKGGIHLPRSCGLVRDFCAVDARGGWVALDNGGAAPNTDKENLALLTGSRESTNQEYLSRYLPGGKREWSTYLGSASGTAFPARVTAGSMTLGVAIDALNNTYVLQGQMGSAQGGSENCVKNAELSKFRPDGKIAWKAQLPFGFDVISLMTVDRTGNTYLVGQSSQFGYHIGKFRTDGKKTWMREPKTETGDVAQKMAVDKYGNVYVAGYRQTSNDDSRRPEAFLAKHDRSGRLVWRRVVPKLDMVTGLAAHGQAVFLSGSLAHPETMSAEMYLMKFGR